MANIIEKITGNYINKPDTRINLSKQIGVTRYVNNLVTLYKNHNFDKIDGEKFVTYCYLLLEETMRRLNLGISQYRSKENYICRKLLGLDMRKHVQDYVENLQEVMLNIDVVGIETFFENRTTLMLNTFDQDLPDVDYENLTDIAKKRFNVYKRMIVAKVLPLLNSLKFMVKGEFEFTGLDSLGINANEQFLALIIKNMLYKEDENMKQALENGTYYDYIKTPNHIINELVKESVVKEREVFIDILTDEEYDMTNDILELFKNTNNLKIVAGMLKGLTYDDNLFTCFVLLLQTQKCVSADKKIKLMLSGEYLSITLIEKEVRWKPTETDIEKIILMNNDEIPYSTWFKLFPQYNALVYNIFNGPVEKAPIA